jgi:hypothetical protein
MVFMGVNLNIPFYLLRSLQKMAKFYQRQNLNAHSSLFHHDLIQILVILHLSKAGDSWHDFVYRHGFFLPENVTDLPLHINEFPSPCRSNPSMENLHVNLQESHVSIVETPVVLQNPSKGNKPRCDFIPKKSLEEVLDDLKDKILTVPNPEPIQFDSNEIDIKKQGRRKKQRSPNINFKNKRLG